MKNVAGINTLWVTHEVYDWTVSVPILVLLELRGQLA
jgi:hypothetical protein